MNILQLSTHIVTYTNLHSTSSIEACKFVEINKSLMKMNKHIC